MKICFPKNRKYPVLGLAVSGGADSVALLLWCNEHKSDLCDRLVVLTCDHQLRGKNSADDVRFVQDLCASLGVDCYSFLLPVREYATAHRLSEEEAGRVLRRAVFEEQIARNVLSAVATAHHADDVVETALFRLFRGTGVGGMAGIRAEDGGILHPMLAVTKAEVLAFLEERGATFRTDESNADDLYSRNFLRNEVLPLVRTRFPKAGESVLRFCASAKEDDDLLCRLAENYVDGATVHACEERALFVRACLSAMRKVGLTADYRTANFDALYDLQFRSVGKTEELCHGFRAEKRQDGIRFFKNPQTFSAPFRLGVVTLPCGTYRASLCAKTDLRVGVSATNALRLDADALANLLPACETAEPCDETDRVTALANRLQAGLYFRSPEEGDRFRPYGHGSEKKLKDFFASKKYAKEERGRSVLLTDGVQTYALLPCEISDRVKLTESSVTICEFLPIKEKTDV